MELYKMDTRERMALDALESSLYDVLRLADDVQNFLSLQEPWLGEGATEEEEEEADALQAEIDDGADAVERVRDLAAALAAELDGLREVVE